MVRLRTSLEIFSFAKDHYTVPIRPIPFVGTTAEMIFSMNHLISSALNHEQTLSRTSGAKTLVAWLYSYSSEHTILELVSNRIAHSFTARRRLSKASALEAG